jgi:hypothetical protein
MIADSSPDEVMNIFDLLNPSSLTIAPEFALSPTKMSTRNLPGGQSAAGA